MITVKLKVERSGFTLTTDLILPSIGVTALFGQSGSGKTTTINAISGIIKPTSGTISIDDHIFFDSSRGINIPTEKRGLGYVFQEGRLFPHMTIEKNLLYGIKSNSNLTPNKNEIIDLLGLHEFLKRKPISLSGGERQRVAIGRALLCSPRILLMDEPLAALDFSRKQEILPYISLLKSTLKIPIIYVSHQIQEIMHLTDTLVLLDHGKVMACGPLDEIINNSKNALLVGSDARSTFLNYKINKHNNEVETTTLLGDGGHLTIRAINKPIGTNIRVRIKAHDISIALEKPKNISITNIFKTKIKFIENNNLGFVDIHLLVEKTFFWSRVTRKSFIALDLKRDQNVYALIESTAIEVLGI